mgnify:CR=1 FL=1
MGRILLISFAIFLVIITLILSFKKNKEIREALALIEKSETTLRDLEEENNTFKDIYLQNIFLLKNIVVKGTFLGLNNSEVPSVDAIKPGETVALFVSDSTCLDCLRSYIALLFKYFYKETVIIRLGPLTDNQEFFEYKIWGLAGFSELDKIVGLKRPLIAFIDNSSILRYVFIPVNSDIDLFEKYLIKLRNTLTYKLPLTGK